MKKKFSIAILLISLFSFVPGRMESIISGFAVKENFSTEYQAIYLSGLCIENITEGRILENIKMLESVREQIDMPIDIKIYFHFPSKQYIVMNVEFTLENYISICFSSENLEIEKALPAFTQVDSLLFQLTDDCIYTLYDDKLYFISRNAAFSLFEKVNTGEAFLYIPSPFENEQMHDVRIFLFNNYDVTKYADEHTVVIGISDIVKPSEDGSLQFNLSDLITHLDNGDQVILH